MKKIFTLGLGSIISIASFAFAPSKLTVFAQNVSGIKVVIDENRFSQQTGDNTVSFDNLQPGYHTVTVYQVDNRRGGFFRRNSMRVLYSGSVNIRPMMATSISVNRFGGARTVETPMRGFDNDRFHDHGFDRNRDMNRNHW